jgi:hypothetical protein
VNRVVRVDVSGQFPLDPLDEAYLEALMDRPDITLVIKGLAEVHQVALSRLGER